MLQSLSTNGFKFIAALILFFFGLCGFFNSKIVKKWKHALVILNCFAGGIYFAVGFVDLMLEGMERSPHISNDLGISQMWPTLIPSLGFLMMLCIDSFVNMLLEKKKMKEKSLGVIPVTLAEEEEEEEEDDDDDDNEKEEEEEEEESDSDDHDHELFKDLEAQFPQNNDQRFGIFRKKLNNGNHSSKEVAFNRLKYIVNNNNNNNKNNNNCTESNNNNNDNNNNNVYIHHQVSTIDEKGESSLYRSSTGGSGPNKKSLLESDYASNDLYHNSINSIPEDDIYGSTTTTNNNNNNNNIEKSSNENHDNVRVHKEAVTDHNNVHFDTVIPPRDDEMKDHEEGADEESIIIKSSPDKKQYFKHLGESFHATSNNSPSTILHLKQLGGNSSSPFTGSHTAAAPKLYSSMDNHSMVSDFHTSFINLKRNVSQIPRNIKKKVKMKPQTLLFGSLWFSLAFHSLIVGLLIGFSEDKEIGSFIGMISHKGMASLGLSASLSHTGYSKKICRIWLFLFACMGPIGILSADLMMGNEKVMDYATVLSSFCAGIFIYMGSIHILANEMNTKNGVRRQRKLFSFLIGYVSMILLVQFTEIENE